MDVSGLVVGIISLYLACQSCYNLYSETKDSTTNVTLAAHQLDIYRSIFKAWAFYWEIKLHDPTAEVSGDDQELANIKLRRYLERNPYKAKGIASALYCIGDALSDKRKLLDAYGIEVDLDDVQIPVCFMCRTLGICHYTNAVNEGRKSTHCTISKRLEQSENRCDLENQDDQLAIYYNSQAHLGTQGQRKVQCPH